MPNLRAWKFTSIFSSKKESILHYYLLNLRHWSIWVNFCIVWGRGSGLFFYMWISHCLKTIFWKKLFSLHLIVLAFLSKFSWSKCEGLFLNVNSISLIYMFSLMPVHTVSIIIVSFEIGKWEFFNFVFSFICFDFNY